MRIEPWGERDLPLLQRCLGDPAMMEHLGGPESAQKISERHINYAQPGSRQFKIIDEDAGKGVGWVGYWERDWQGEQVYEIGWAVIPAFQGRGIAVSATLEAIAIARSEKDRRWLHAFPSVDNSPSNAICQKLGFTLRGPCDFEYPKGRTMRCNDWRLDLCATPQPESPQPIMSSVIDEVLAAINASDLDRFMGCYASDATIIDGEDRVLARGQDEIRDRYQQMFTEFPRLHVEQHGRLEAGRYIVEDELVTGRGPGPEHQIAVYLVIDDHIACERLLR